MSSILTRSSQILAHGSFFADWTNFRMKMGDLKNSQKNILEQTLKNHPYLKSEKDFLNQPVQDYGALKSLLDGSLPAGTRHQPTSGTGDKEKLIPYTKEFIRQLNTALNPWLFDLAKTYPSILMGKHYWSLSWLPTHWRQNGWHLDDFELLPEWKKNITRNLLAVPNEVSKAPTLESSQFATLAWLASSHDLTFISVWSPTFMLQLLELMHEWRVPLAKTLEAGKWAMFGRELEYLAAPQNKLQAKILLNKSIIDLWPELKLISSWDSSSSTLWAKKLSSLFPNAAFQGKGLWATEGVVTIPFEGKFVLSYLSHYYEFIEISTGRLLPSYELKEGMEVYPVLTCANGFTRYQMKDRLAVTGFSQSVPTLQFLERDDTFDMVGEKIDSKTLLELHNLLKDEFSKLAWVTGFVVNEKNQKPYYKFIFEGSADQDALKQVMQKFLHQHFHYQLAKELGQLGPEQVFLSSDAFHRYQNYQIERGMVQGNIKVELATKITSEREISLFHRHF